MVSSPSICTSSGLPSANISVKREYLPPNQTDCSVHPFGRNTATTAGSMDPSWMMPSELQQQEESLDNLMNTAPPMNWPPSPHAPTLGYPDHMYYSTAPGLAEENIPHGLSMPHSSYAYDMPNISPADTLVPDPGRPRTVPTFDDLDPNNLHPIPAYGGNNTIEPQQIYAYGPPRSDPSSYPDDLAPYSHGLPTIAESIEAGSPAHHDPHYGLYSGVAREESGGDSWRSTPFDEEVPMDDDEAFEGEKHEPYAKLLYRCLKDAPGHTLVLKDIYEWFKFHTAKGRETPEKAWQNSIRHNLSMNKAFEKVDLHNTASDEPARKGYQWRLSDKALREGRVESTTRYRNKQPNKRGHKSMNPSRTRQAAGQKGGSAAKIQAEQRRSQRLRDARSEFRSSLHNLRERGILPNDSYGGLVSRGGSPVPQQTVMYEDRVSAPASPYHIPSAHPDSMYPTPNIGYFPPQHPGYDPDATPTNGPGAGYTSSPTTHWLTPGDTVFYDSSEAGTGANTPLTAGSFEEGLRGQSPWEM